MSRGNHVEADGDGGSPPHLGLGVSPEGDPTRARNQVRVIPRCRIGDVSFVVEIDEIVFITVTDPTTARQQG